MNDGVTILWRRLDLPGHEIATILRRADEWILIGVAILVDADKPCRVEYEIRCDSEWKTRACALRGSIGTKRVHVDIERTARREWLVDGVEVEAVRGCDDIDLGFSPVTNLVPIRRLALPVGEHGFVRAAWVRFPELTVEVLEQTYARIDRTHYRYESAGGAFRRELTVDEFGCVVEYPGLWHAEATAAHGPPIV